MGCSSVGYGCGSDGDMAEEMPRGGLAWGIGCQLRKCGESLYRIVSGGSVTLRLCWFIDHLVEHEEWIKPWMGV